MKKPVWFVLIVLVVSGCVASHPRNERPVAWVPDWLPPARTNGPTLCQRAYLKPAQGKMFLDEVTAHFPGRASWDAYAKHLRLRIQEGAGLSPWPKRTPLNVIIRNPRLHDGYIVENIAIESIPGYFLTGNIYRPLHAKPSFPVVLATHGHELDQMTRFSADTQYRCATLARMGAVVLAVDMFGYGDSIQELGAGAHAHPFSLTMQAWDNMRALDYLLSLPGADHDRVAVTGESGGATQSLILTALDSRVKLAVPVVMVSSYYFGGCPCENGMPIHRSADHFADNAMIAALAAPRPMLLVSDGSDWTQNTPEVEFPFLRKIYSYYRADTNVANVHLPDEKHDYGPSKRQAMYRFIGGRFHMDLAAVKGADEKIDESNVTIEPASVLSVFDARFPVPARTLRSAVAVEHVFHLLQPTAGQPPSEKAASPK